MTKPTCRVIAGPNGSGKTTFATDFLPLYVDCQNFVNPDLLAKAFSPFNPDTAHLKAAKMTLELMDENIAAKRDFAFETTLSGRSYAVKLRKIKDAGYAVSMFYLWVPSTELTIQRIKERVSQGGHDVPTRDVLRRFDRTLSNLFTLYRPLLDDLLFFDNSGKIPRLIFKDSGGETSIMDAPFYKRLTKDFPQ